MGKLIEEAFGPLPKPIGAVNMEREIMDNGNLLYIRVDEEDLPKLMSLKDVFMLLQFMLKSGRPIKRSSFVKAVGTRLENLANKRLVRAEDRRQYGDSVHVYVDVAASSRFAKDSLRTFIDYKLISMYSKELRTRKVLEPYTAMMIVLTEKGRNVK